MHVITQNPQMPQAPPIVQQQPPCASTGNVHWDYNHNHAFGRGITQVVVGMLCVAAQTFAIRSHAHMAYVYTGVWCGIVVSVMGLSKILRFSDLSF